MNRKRLVPGSVVTITLIAMVTLAGISVPGAGEGKAYGKPLSGQDTTKISEIMAHPDTYVGKTVRVEGTVTAVCEKAGCWMTLASDKASQDLRIKVDDGVIVFPVEARGKRAVAEGVLTKIAMTLDETIAWKKHEAEEQKKEFDPGSVKEPMTFYQIQATGAVVH